MGTEAPDPEPEQEDGGGSGGTPGGGGSGGSSGPSNVVQIKFDNRSPSPRKDYWLATIPLTDGTYDGSQSVKVTGETFPANSVEMRRLGTPYDSGFYRMVQIAVPGSVSGNSSKTLTLIFNDGDGNGEVVKSTVTSNPFSSIQSTSEPGGSGSDHFEFGNGLAQSLNRAEGAYFDITIQTNSGQKYLRFNFASCGVIEHQSIVRFWKRCISRVGNGEVVAILYLNFFKGQDYVPFSIQLISDPSVNNLFTTFNSIELSTHSTDVLFLRGEQRRGVTRLDGNRVRVLNQGHMVWGQSQQYYGVIAHTAGASNVGLHTVAAGTHEIYGIADNWENVSNYGPYGVVPAPKNRSDAIQEALGRVTQFESYLTQSGSPWENRPLGMSSAPSATGGQQDFALISRTGLMAMNTQVGGLVNELLFNVGEDFLRHFHYISPQTGDLITTLSNPNVFLYHQIPDARQSSAFDMMGRNQSHTDIAHAYETFNNGMSGYDGAHFSINDLLAAYALTGRPEIGGMLENLVETSMLTRGFGSRIGEVPVAGSQPRDPGRSHWMLNSAYLLTGNPRIQEFLSLQTTQHIIPRIQGQPSYSPTVDILYYENLSGSVCFLEETNPSSDHDCIASWMEAILGHGLLATCKVSHTPAACTMAEQHILSQLRHQYVIQRDSILNQISNVRIAYRYYLNLDGSALASHIEDFNVTLPSFSSSNGGGGLTTWSLSNLVWVEEMSTATPADKAKAIEILDWYRTRADHTNNYYSEYQVFIAPAISSSHPLFGL